MIFCYLLIIVNVIVYIKQTKGSIDIDDYSMSYYSVFVRKEYYRLFTSSFIHGSTLHLILNMISLYNIVSTLVYFLSTFEIILVYFLSIGVGHSLCLRIRHNNYEDNFTSIGASGGICGLIGVYFVTIFTLVGSLAFESILRSLVSIALISFVPGVDGKGHICCLATGIVLGFLVCIL